jgi:hypothetical protein
MIDSRSHSTYHARFCALENWKVSLIFFLFSALQVVLRWRAVGGSPRGQEQTVIFYVGVVAVIAALGDLVVALKCFRERVVLALTIVSLVFILVKASCPDVVAPVATASERAMLILWMIACAVSLSMLVSAFHAPRRDRAESK